MATIETRQSNGKTTYRVRVRRKGAPALTATFYTKTQAKDWANKMETEIKENLYFPKMQAQRHTLNELIILYTDKLSHALNSQDTSLAQLRVWGQILGDYSLATITPDRIYKTLNEIEHTKTPGGKEKSAATLNRYLAVLSSALSFANKELGWIQENPAFKVSKRQEPQGRVRFLSDDERNRLLDAVKHASNPYLYPAVVLAISTGARKMEILNLKWTDIDLNENWIRLEKTKNGTRRGLPLKDLALELMHKLYAERKNNEWVFPNEANNGPFDIRRSWEKALQEAEIYNFRFHDLRHTCASYLIMNGATPGEIADVLGHKTLQMVKRYAHIADPHKASVIEKMNDKIFGNTKDIK